MLVAEKNIEKESRHRHDHDKNNSHRPMGRNQSRPSFGGGRYGRGSRCHDFAYLRGAVGARIRHVRKGMARIGASIRPRGGLGARLRLRAINECQDFGDRRVQLRGNDSADLHAAIEGLCERLVLNDGNLVPACLSLDLLG